jgi:hypothetical protein
MNVNPFETMFLSESVRRLDPIVNGAPLPPLSVVVPATTAVPRHNAHSPGSDGSPSDDVGLATAGL